jgi:glycosyltransferase involved in cell wall biosynthesis
LTQFSIIVCTHNPNEYIFRRLLTALSKFAKSGILFEILLVDNNSITSIGLRDYVKDFVENPSHNARVILEVTRGLTSARLRGISEAKNDWLVFFDDDNEPNEDYLAGCSLIISKYPNVCVWGPGIVKVEYLKVKTSKWFNENKHFYQESFHDTVLFDNKPEWCNFYPNGTGLVVKKNVSILYKNLNVMGELTLTDRIGKSLVSGGDTQLVLCAIKLGYFVGVSPQLKLIHLICENKINRSYLIKQVYMTATCYLKAFNELNFENNRIPIFLEGNLRIFILLYYSCRVHLFRLSVNDFLMHFSSKLGEVNARYYASNSNSKPLMLRVFEKLINV